MQLVLLLHEMVKKWIPKLLVAIHVVITITFGMGPEIGVANNIELLGHPD